jgi:hypothetical protein
MRQFFIQIAVWFVNLFLLMGAGMVLTRKYLDITFQHRLLLAHPKIKMYKCKN